MVLPPQWLLSCHPYCHLQCGHQDPAGMSTLQLVLKEVIEENTRLRAGLDTRDQVGVMDVVEEKLGGGKLGRRARKRAAAEVGVLREK